MTMPSSQELTARARLKAQQMLGDLPAYHDLPIHEKFELYKSLVQQQADEMARQNGGVATAQAKKASELIDDARHLNKRIEQAGQLAGEFINDVDFPKFVGDLLKAVFDANLRVTVEQMEAYQNLLKTATASISKFVTAIDDTAAFGYLAENNSDSFGIDFDDEQKDESGNAKMVLTDKEGNKLDLGDNEVKAKIMDAKIAMAREQRALLRETILMGVTRLVIDRGVVKASVNFDIKATEKIDKQDKAAIKQASSSGFTGKASAGLVGMVVGGPSAGYTRSNQKTQISISSAKSTSSTDLSAKLAGSVEIVFKSDYFKLDNFASMYSGGSEAAPAKPGAGAAPPAALPAGS